MDASLRGKIDQACRTADEFTKLYYDSVDKRRHQMSRLYLDTGLLVWNGNESMGKENIQKYFENLPGSHTTLTTLDAQPIAAETVSMQPTFLIQVTGNIKFPNIPQKPFQQTFVITAQNEKWKIASDVFRIQDAIFTNNKK